MAKKRQHSAYSVAVADYFHAPDIKEVDLGGYTGTAGDLISVKVTDDFKVKGFPFDWLKDRLSFGY